MIMIEKNPKNIKTEKKMLMLMLMIMLRKRILIVVSVTSCLIDVSKMLKGLRNKHTFVGQIYFGEVLCHGHLVQL